MAKGSAQEPIDLDIDLPDWRPAPKPKPPARRPPVSPTFIDLTCSDDEEQPRCWKQKSFSMPHDNSIMISEDGADDESQGPSRGSSSRASASGSRTTVPKQRALPDPAVAQRQSLIDNPINATTTTNAAKPLSAGPEPNAAQVEPLALLATGSGSTPDRQGSTTEDASVDRPSTGPEEWLEKNSTPVSVLVTKTDSVAVLPSSLNPTAKGSPNPQSTHTPSDIPLRPTPRPAFSPKVPAKQALVPSSPSTNSFMTAIGQLKSTSIGFSRLDYVLDRNPGSSAPKVARDPERSDKGNVEKMPTPGAHVPGSKQVVSESSQPAEPQKAIMRKSVSSGLRPAPKIGPKVVSAHSRLRNDVPTALLSSLCGPSSNTPSTSTNDQPCHDQQIPKQGISYIVVPPVQAPVHAAKASPIPSIENEQRQAEQATEQGSDNFIVPQAQVATNVMPPINAHNLEATSAIVDECLKQHLRKVRETHAKVVRACLQRQRTCFEREGRLKERSMMQGSALTPPGADRYAQTSSPFKKMQPIQATVLHKGAVSLYFTQEIFTKTRIKNGIESKITAPITRYRSTAVDVPAFREYVSLQDNVLAENEKSLLNWPYFPGEMNLKDMETELGERYKMKNVTQPWHDLLSDVHQFYGPSADSLLADIGLGWEDVLYWHLASEVDIKRINSTLEHASADFEPLLLKRKLQLDDNFDRDVPKWGRLLKRLPQPTAVKLRLAALTSSSFLKQCDFDLWHIARRSDFLRNQISGRLKGNTECPEFRYKSAMCRICQMHNCLFHGELREHPEEEDAIVTESQKSYSELADPGNARSEDAATKTDEGAEFMSGSDVEEVVNYRRAVNTHTLPPYVALEEEDEELITRPVGEFKGDWWLRYTNAAKWEHRKPFYPCSHEGTCDQAQCRCYRENITCEKSCKCSTSCRRRFPGCSCAQTTGKQPLCGTKNCLCHKMDRECDADMCGSCGAREILDPINRHKDDITRGKCCNVALQRGVQKKTLLGHSEVHGFGLYTGEDVKADDFLGEYKGETITLSEMDRRAIIYDKQKTMYLFNLNQEQVVDSTHFGNKTRFINNSSEDSANCYPRNLLCNTVYRIGLYARKDIPAGTELFFRYNYEEWQTQYFKEPGGKRSTSGKSKKPNGTNGKLVAVKAKSKGRRGQTTKAPAVMLSKKGEKQQTALKSAGAPQRARKSAPNDSFTGPRRILPRSGVNTPDGTSDAQPIRPSIPGEPQDVQESDDGDDYVPSELNVLGLDDGVTDPDDAYESRPGRKRTRRRMAPVVAVKQHKQSAGPRPSISAKRKRAVPSDDEDE